MMLGGNSIQLSILDFAYKYVHLTPPHIVGPEIPPVSQSVQPLSHIQLCDPKDCCVPGFPVHHQLLELLKLMSIELVMPSNHLILCHPLPLRPSIFPSIRVFFSFFFLHQVAKILELQL